MSRIKYVLLSLLFINLSFADPQGVVPSGWVNGSGGEITSLEELKWLTETSDAWDEDWVLTTDIDASDTRTWNNGGKGAQGLEPIGAPIWGRMRVPFTGSFDGQGHVISNLYMNWDWYDDIGFFGALDRGAIVVNLGLKNAEIIGRTFVGGLVGFAGESQIINSFFEGSVTGITSVGGLVALADEAIIDSVYSSGSVKTLGDSANVNNVAGGLAANFQDGRISRSFSTSDVTGVDFVGGFVGHAKTNGTIENSFATGRVTSNGKYVGSFIGANNVDVMNCYATGLVDASNTYGGFIGFNMSSGTISSGAFDTQTTGIHIGIGLDSNSQNVSALTTALFTSNNLVGWDFDVTWKFDRMNPIDANARPYFRLLNKVQFSTQGNGFILENQNAFQVLLPGFSSDSVTAIQNPGSYFTEWDDISNDRTFVGNKIAVDKVVHDEFIVANFELYEYDVKFVALDHGYLLGDTNQTVKYGNDAESVTAVPDTAYEFSYWRDAGGRRLQNPNPVVLGDIQKDTTIYAFFQRKSYLVQYTAGDHGSVSNDAVHTVSHGFTTPATSGFPDEGYHFLEWRDTSGNFVSADNPYNIPVVTSDSLIVAIFEINTYTIEYHHDDNGVVQGDTIQSVDHGLFTTEVVATANKGYEFAGWTNAQDSIVSTSNPLILTGVTGDVSLTATFSIQSYTVEFVAGENGELEGESTQIVQYNGNADTILAVADSTYRFAVWQDTLGNVVSTDNPLVLDTVVSDTILTALFLEKDLYIVNFQARGYGSIQGELNQTVRDGDSTLEVVAKANEGGIFREWQYLNGTTFSADTAITIPDVSKDAILIAVFDTLSYEVVFSSDSNGSLSGDTLQQIQYLMRTDLITAVPNEDFFFDKWVNEQGDSVSADNPLVIDDVVQNLSFKAVFKPRDIFNITFISDENGSLEGDVTQKIHSGDSSSSVLAVPHEHYQFMGWFIGDSLISVTNPYTIDFVYQDVELTASFELVSYTITASSSDVGVQLNIEEFKIKHGDTLVAQIFIKEGYKLDSILYNKYDVITQIIKGQGVTIYKRSITEDGHLEVYVSEDKESSIIYNRYFPVEVQFNPSYSNIWVSSSKEIAFVLYNIHGDVVQSSHGKYKKQWDVSIHEFAAGTYVLGLESSDERGYRVLQIK